MTNKDLFLESVKLYAEASNLILSTLPLQQQIRECNTELAILIGSETALPTKHTSVT